MPGIGILIPVYNNLDYTKKCLANICGNLQESDINKNFHTIVIDDGSTDGTSAWARNHYPTVTVLEGDGNLWWSGGINRGAEYAIEKLGCSYILLWNNDIEIAPEYFKTIMQLTEEYNEDTILGSKIYANNEQTIIWSMGGWFNPATGSFGMRNYMISENGKYNIPIEADWLTGMGTLIPANIIKQIGYWDEKNFPQYHGDTEFTYRAHSKGFRVIVDPRLVICNDVIHTGLVHDGSFKKLIRLLNDKRSLYNVKVNLKFYRLYAKSPLAYSRIVKIPLIKLTPSTFSILWSGT